MEEVYRSILRGEYPDKTNVPIKFNYKLISTDLLDLLIITKYIGSKVSVLFYNLYQSENIDDYSNINEFAKELEKFSPIEIGNIVERNKNTLLYLANNFNICFIVDTYTIDTIIDHPNIHYEIIDRHLLIPILNIIPRNRMYIYSANVIDLINNNIILNNEELDYIELYIDNNTIDDSFIDLIPQINHKIHISKEIVKNLIENHEYELLNKLFKKCNIKYESINNYIKYSHELIQYVNIIWVTDNIDNIKINNNIYYIVRSKYIDILDEYDIIKNCAIMTFSIHEIIRKKYPHIKVARIVME